LGDSSTAEPQALNLLILVRIQVPQHFKTDETKSSVFVFMKSPFQKYLPAKYHLPRQNKRA
jgi:hypothetical protein